MTKKQKTPAGFAPIRDAQKQTGISMSMLYRLVRSGAVRSQKTDGLTAGHSGPTLVSIDDCKRAASELLMARAPASIIMAAAGRAMMAKPDKHQK